MEKRLLAIFAVILTCAQLYSQTTESSHRFEVGAGASAFGILGTVGGIGQDFGINVFFEYRYELSDHFDIGAKIDYKYRTGETSDPPVKSFNIHQLGMKLLSDFKICPKRKVCPYIGLGLGVGDGILAATGNTNDEFIGLLTPRVGIQIKKHLRIAIELDYATTFDDNSIFNGGGFDSLWSAKALNVSWTF